ncbi:antA/AntB antirepressor family protein [Flexithrix dorotheae]|uniref:antA/AntB antirepressor family protein n=1 Tax=Flexithrix dorotheae TaxID=70993 RepID=UPI000365FA9C|nr:antA/AntB antirepressor family protein [Flexithrix dorotheae]
MELIKIYQGNLINARELWEFLEVKTRFNDWIIRMFEYGFEENKDYFTVLKKEYRHTLKEYHLKIGTAKEISMIQRSEKGRQARKYFIEAEETLIKLKENKRLDYWNKLQDGKSKLLNYLLEKGHTEDNFIQIDHEARKVLFNGEPLPDEVLPDVLLTARSFAVALSKEVLEEQEESDLGEIEKTHKDNHADVRKLIKDNTKKLPEDYKPEEDIKKLGQ